MSEGRAIGAWVEASPGLDAVMVDGAPRLTGAALAARRQALGLTLAGMGEHLGVRADTVKQWEKGKSDVPYRVPSELYELQAE